MLLTANHTEQVADLESTVWEAAGEDTVFVCYEDLLEDAHEASKSIDFSALSTIDETFQYLNGDERNLLLLKGRGYTKKEMAKSLDTCEKTVYNPLSLIKEKITRTHN